MVSSVQDGSHDEDADGTTNATKNPAAKKTAKKKTDPRILRAAAGTRAKKLAVVKKLKFDAEEELGKITNASLVDM